MNPSERNIELTEGSPGFRLMARTAGYTVVIETRSILGDYIYKSRPDITFVGPGRENG
jgi:hypothetical protein